MSENNEKYLKRTKGITLAIAILSTLSSLLSLLLSTIILIMQNVDWTTIGMSAEEAAEVSGILVHPILYYSYFTTIVGIVFCIIMYIFHAKLRKGEVVSQIPYFIPPILLVITIILSVIQQSSGIFSILLDSIVPVLAILAIINLSKIKQENTTEILTL